MRKCGVCSSINSYEAIHCHYCGYKINDYYEYSSNEKNYLYQRIDNVSKGKILPFLKEKRIENTLVKRNKIFERINRESDKLKKIELALHNVGTDENKQLIEGITKRIENLIIELLKCGINIEFCRYAGNLKNIKHSIRYESINVDEINLLLAEQQEDIDKWERDLTGKYKSSVIRDYCKTKLSQFQKLKEEIALKMISGILSNTTLIKNEGDTIENESIDEIQNEVERINYEIDRLNGELQL